ncbi:troponin C isoform 3 [Penaeus vannamei]|uniref:Troponin C isoform 3 n=1 Tax=Penaeus vannamei TaxID=6689 RepID=A0A423SVU5_PENVA|nr:troponin C isoform 3 [Penaeus vannamei]
MYGSCDVLDLLERKVKTWAAYTGAEGARGDTAAVQAAGAGDARTPTLCTTTWIRLRRTRLRISEKNLQEVIAETDEDGSGMLEFEEFVELAAKFLIEEDEESLKAELKEAFRIYDKEGNGYITTDTLKEILKELDNRLTNEELDGIIEEVDEDGES